MDALSLPTSLAPIITEHDGILVVRDDLFPGGTKARFIPALFDGADEVVYATPGEGGAQMALAMVAAQLGKRATLFCAARAKPHPRVVMGRALGATYHFVSPGYLNVVQARAAEYAALTGARLAPFGMDMPEAIDAIAAAAKATGVEPDEVWCAAGSGVLARALARVWPWADRHVVQVGRELTRADVDGATIHTQPLAFGRAYTGGKDGPIVPFPADPHYGTKAWAVCTRNVHEQKRARKGRVLFWCVTGPADTAAVA